MRSSEFGSNAFAMLGQSSFQVHSVASVEMFISATENVDVMSLVQLLSEKPFEFGGI
jgi:hypothetical protein